MSAKAYLPADPCFKVVIGRDHPVGPTLPFRRIFAGGRLEWLSRGSSLHGRVLRLSLRFDLWHRTMGTVRIRVDQLEVGRAKTSTGDDHVLPDFGHGSAEGHGRFDRVFGLAMPGGALVFDDGYAVVTGALLLGPPFRRSSFLGAFVLTRHWRYRRATSTQAASTMAGMATQHDNRVGLAGGPPMVLLIVIVPPQRSGHIRPDEWSASRHSAGPGAHRAEGPNPIRRAEALGTEVFAENVYKSRRSRSSRC